MTAVDVDLFNKLKGLKSLDLSQNQLIYIPDDLKLPVLTVLDCTQNCLQSVSFAQNFRKLKELYFDENKQLSVSIHVIGNNFMSELCHAKRMSNVDVL